jgi:hypothetical protein
VLFAKERNKHKGKTPKKQCKAQKLVSAKRNFITKSPWHVSINKRMIDKTFEE